MTLSVPSRFKHFLVERNEFSKDGTETLLSVSEYYGVKPRAEAFDEDRQESRAESLEGYRIVRKGDLVMNYMLAWKGAYGISEHDGIVSPAYSVFKVDAHAIDLRYLHHRTRSKDMQAIFKQNSRGIMESRLRLYPENLLSLRLPLPPIAEQTAIAHFLDRETARIDSLIEKKGRFIELLKEKRAAVITHAVTKGLDPNAPMKDSGVAWLGDVPATWQVKKLKHLCKVRTGGRDTAHAVPGAAYPFFVRSQTVEQIDTFSADCEAILTAGDGAGVGKVYHYYVGKFDFHQRVYMLSRFEQVKGRFLFFYLSSLFAAVALDGGAKSTVDSLRMPVFMNFRVTVPDYEEQARILDFVETQSIRIDTLIAKTERSIELLREKRSALITAAVTGKIDVRAAA